MHKCHPCIHKLIMLLSCNSCEFQKYGLGNEVSAHDDVYRYSYGIQLVEMFTRKKGQQAMNFSGNFSLHKSIFISLIKLIPTKNSISTWHSYHLPLKVKSSH